jgi:hypothetical protein
MRFRDSTADLGATELSSRPERSGVERPAVSSLGLEVDSCAGRNTVADRWKRAHSGASRFAKYSEGSKSARQPCTSIFYRTKKLFIRDVITHAEYEKGRCNK